MHLVIHSQYYPPEIGAPQNRLSELAERMVQQGHRVTVLTAMPNYPTGKIYPGYGGLLRRAQRHGVRVIRTFIYPTQRADFLPRLSSYFSFVLSSGLLGSLLVRRADYWLVESPPLFLGLAAVWLSRRTRARLIFNVSDLWPESAVRLGLLRPGSRAFRLSAGLEAFCYRQAWLVSGQSKSILANIQDRFPHTRTFHLSNGVDTQKFGPQQHVPEARHALGAPDELVAVYAGLHGLAQGLDQLLDAMGLLAGDLPVRLVLIGDGPEKEQLRRQAARQGLRTVHFLDPRPAGAIPAILAAADVILVPLKTYLPGAVPSKLYEAMASARPVILVACGEAAEIVQTHQAGIVVPPGDAAALAAALRTLHAQPELRHRLGQNGRRAAVAYFDRAQIVRGFVQYLEAQRRR